VRAAVASLLEGSSPESRVSPLVATGRVTEAEGRFRLQIQLDSRGASETKTMDAAACDTLADAFALVVAFTVDPSVSRRQPPPVAAPGRETTSVIGRREPPMAVREGAPTRVAVGPLVALGAGALPFPAYGLGARIAIENVGGGPRWELAGTIWPKEPSATVATDASHSAGADIWLAAAEPSACLALAHGAIAPCLGGELGAQRGRGTGVRVSGSGASWWLALTAGVSLRAPLTPGVGLRFRFDVGLPLLRPAFMLENVGPEGSAIQAFRPAPVVGVVSFEPEFQLFSTERRESRHDSH
jgi:hypothetical protein